MEYTIECFMNTGFSQGNIPDSAAKLRQLVAPITFPAIWTLQNREVSSIRVETTYDRIKDTDYVCIRDVYYWVTVINMINENVAELQLVTDYITTMGLSSLGITSAWCTRRHVTNDGIFVNVIEEDFIPSKELVIDIGTSIGDIAPAQEYYNVMASTVFLSKMNFEADTYTNIIDSFTVTVPKLPAVPIDSLLKMELPDGERQFTLPQVGLFDADNVEIKDAIQSVRSLGVESAIIAGYKLPKNLCECDGEYGWFSYAKGKLIDNLQSGLPYEYMQGIKNKKAFSGQFQKYRLYSITSGSSLEYQPEDITHEGDTEPSFVIFSDPQPGGKPYCRPKYYKGDSTNLFIECVPGSTWLNYQLIYRGASGQAFSDLEYTKGSVQRFISGSVSAIPQLATGNYLGAMGEGVSFLKDFADSSQEYGIKKNTVVPDIHFPLSSTLQNYYANSFWVSRVRLSDEDTVRFDNYLTQYGYAVYEPFSPSCFTGRKYFNYVQLTGVTMKNSYPLYMRMGAIKQLTGGVRIWHTLPDIQYMYDNPIEV